MSLYRFSHKNQGHFTYQGWREALQSELGELAHVLGKARGVLIGAAHTVGGAVHWASAVHWARSSNAIFNGRGAPVVRDA